MIFIINKTPIDRKTTGHHLQGPSSEEIEEKSQKEKKRKREQKAKEEKDQIFEQEKKKQNKSHMIKGF